MKTIKELEVKQHRYQGHTDDFCRYCFERAVKIQALKDVIKLIEELEKETAKEEGMDIKDVLINGEELKAKIEG